MRRQRQRGFEVVVSGGQQVCDDPRRERLAVVVLGHCEGGVSGRNNGEVQWRQVRVIETEVGVIDTC